MFIGLSKSEITLLVGLGYANGVIGQGESLLFCVVAYIAHKRDSEYQYANSIWVTPISQIYVTYYGLIYFSIHFLSKVLKRTYGDNAVKAHNYSTILSSLTFAGTVVGMLIFGYLSDKIGRKFGMVSSQRDFLFCLHSPSSPSLAVQQS